jgi:hypothetical protein
MVDVRTEIWDYLYRNGPTSLDTIANTLGQSSQAIEQAVSHEWFTVKANVAAIAVSNKVQAESPRQTGESPMSEENSIQTLRDLFGS